MRYSFTLRIFGRIMNSVIGSQITDKTILQAICQEYQAILLRAKDIGNHNMLLSSYALAAYFIAMNRCTLFPARKNYEILKTGMTNSKLLKKFLGTGEDYFSEKRMKRRRSWALQTHERRYKNDWVVDVLETTEDYVFGLDYYECGVCKLCQDENCRELAKYMCKLDYLLVEIIGIHLDRTTTLADGEEKCDFRFSD